MEIYVETLLGTRFKFTVQPSETVLSIKIKIMQHEGIPVQDQDIIFGDKVLNDEDKFETIGVTEFDTLKLIIKLRGGPLSIRPVFSEEDAVVEENDDQVELDQISNLFPRHSESSSRDLTLIILQKGGNVRILEFHTSPQPSTPKKLSSEENEEGISNESPAPASNVRPPPIRRPSMERLNSFRPPSLEISEKASTAENNDNIDVKKDSMTSLEKSMTQLRLQRPTIDPAKLSRDSCESTTRSSRYHQYPTRPPLQRHNTELFHKPLINNSNINNTTRTRRVLSKSFSFDGSTSRQFNLDFGPSKFFSTIPPPVTKSREGSRVPFLINVNQTPNQSKPSINRLPSTTIERPQNAEPAVSKPAVNSLPTLPEKTSSRYKRCYVCSKRLKLAADFQCRCGELFCSQHRYPEEHDCPIDFKAGGRIDIAKSNPLVIADKLPRI